MADIAREILHINLEDEMRQSYLDYAMSVIVGRALPDVRDGLKPVHRRVLYAMHELSNDWNKAYKKSARIVGDVIGKYHPHGDSAVYDSIVRMAQQFSMRYLLVDGQGNFGSVDGDPAAAMRYTEVRMSRIAHELLADIDKDTVDFTPNYDESEHEPAVLPSRVPNLLINGSAGIAVGMATNIPPHNLREIIDACIALIDAPMITLGELMKIVPGPDFPTAGIINGAAEIGAAYATGRGRLYVRGRTSIEEMDKGRQSIIITELPYQVNKARLLERIADLVRNKEIEGISELRDESDKDGMRVVIELRRAEMPEIVLNNLYKHTPLETVFGINMVALVDGQPKLLGLKELLDCFIRHRREVVTRRTVFELKRARDRAHVLEGQAVALGNIDDVIAVIKAAQTPNDAKVALMGRSWAAGAVPEMLARAGEVSARPEGLAPEFGLANAAGGQAQYRLSEIQAQAILDLRLQRLTGLERDKIVNEYGEILDPDRRPKRHPCPPGAPAERDPRRAYGNPRAVRRCAAHRDQLRSFGPDDRRSDRRSAGGRDAVARRLRQIPADERIPATEPGRPRQERHRDEGRGLHRAYVRRAHARYALVLFQSWPGLLAAGVSAATRRARFQRQADREPADSRGG